MNRLLLLFVFSILMAFSLYADPVQGVGFAAGQLSGVGLSYRVMMEDYGAQITVGGLSLKGDNYEETYPQRPYYDDEFPKSELYGYTQTRWIRETHANIGLMLMKSLHKSKYSTLYAFTGFSAFLNWDTIEEQQFEPQDVGDYYEYVAVGDKKTRVRDDNTFYGGFGLGFEIRFTANIRLAIEWPLTFSSDGDFVMYIPQAGLHYFF